MKSFQSAEYKKLTDNVAIESEFLRAFQTSKQRLVWLIAEISNLVPQNPGTVANNAAPNDYDAAFEKIQQLLRQAVAVSKELDESKLNQSEKRLEDALLESKAKLSAYLSEKGLKPESQQDVADASENISNLKTKIDEAKNQLEVLVKKIRAFSTAALDEAKRAALHRKWGQQGLSRVKER